MAAAKKRPKPVRRVEDADVALTRKAAPWRRSGPVRAIGAMAELADQPPMIGLASGLLLGAIAFRQPRLARAAVRMLGSVLAATAMKTAVKRAVDRTRPHLLVEEGHYRLDKGTSTEDGEINSFPSGHTADAVSAAIAVSRDYPAFAPVAGTLATAVALVQIPRCRHFVSDVGAGAIIGVVAEAAVDAALDVVADRLQAIPPAAGRASRLLPSPHLGPQGGGA